MMLIILKQAVSGSELYKALNKTLSEFEEDEFFDFKADIDYCFGPEAKNREIYRFTLRLMVYRERRPDIIDELIDVFRKWMRKDKAGKEKRPDRARYVLFEFPVIYATKNYEEITVDAFDVYEIYDLEFGFHKGSDKKTLTTLPDEALEYFERFSQSLLKHLGV